MKQSYKDHKFTPAALVRLTMINTIIERYTAMGLRLTLRQLYYQLVTQNIIKNEEKEYKRLSELLANGRLAGIVDWDAIEDRLRRPSAAPQWNTIQDLVSSAVAQFRLPRWANQGNYVELWVEKDALAGVLAPIARTHHITLMVNRGYSSISAMKESADRINEGRDRERNNKEAYVLYLGDHDPSGEDMVRDVQERLEMFECEVTVRKLALTTAQVRKYKPPPNPTKMTDSRSPKYVAVHGATCWEVDAIPPEELAKIVRSAIVEYMDMVAYKEVMEEEEVLRNKLQEAAESIE